MNNDSGLAWAVEQIVNLIPAIDSYIGATKEQKKKALSAISEALFDTQAYINKTKGPNPPVDRDEEARLAKLWSTAGIESTFAKFHDKEGCSFSNYCQQKAKFWIAVDHWEGSKASDLNISIENITKLYSDQLKSAR